MAEERKKSESKYSMIRWSALKQKQEIEEFVYKTEKIPLATWMRKLALQEYERRQAESSKAA